MTDKETKEFPTEDLFGTILMDYLYGERAKHSIRRDDGYIDEIDTDIYFRKYSQFSEQEKKVLKHVKGRVLDVGCGAGQHALWLQEKGRPVVGIDISPLAIEVASRQGLKHCQIGSGLNLPFKPGSFETILLMGNNLGIGGDIENTQKLLKELHRVTTEDGIVIATSRDPRVTEKRAHLKYHEMNRKRGRPIGQVRIRMEYKGKVGNWFNFIMFQPEELEELCKETGWRRDKFFKEKDSAYASVLKKV